MRMLDSSLVDEPEVEVTRLDQANINRFSNLNVRYEELLVQLQVKRDQLDYFSDLENELMILDDDELVMYKLETSYAHMTPSKANEMTQLNKEKLSDMVDNLQSELNECEEEMDKLKKTLYSKFGKTINLERTDSA